MLYLNRLINYFKKMHVYFIKIFNKNIKIYFDRRMLESRSIRSFVKIIALYKTPYKAPFKNSSVKRYFDFKKLTLKIAKKP